MLRKGINNSNIYICLCSKITENTFISYIRSHSSASLDDIYNELNVGNTCSACRLKLETSYLEEKTYSHDINNLNKKFNFKRKFRKYIKNIDNFFSVKKVILHQGAPIFGGDKVSTSLIVSNIIPEGLEQHAAVFKLKIYIRNTDGLIIDSQVLSLKAGKRIVLPLNKDKTLNKSKKLLSVGSLWVKIIPITRGYLGFTRPHIRLDSKNSISTIHLQNGKKNKIELFTIIKNHENQYFSLISMEDRNIKINIKVYIKSDLKKEYKNVLYPFQSALIKINDILTNNYNNKELSIVMTHDGIIRRNFLIEDVNKSTISVDHI